MPAPQLAEIAHVIQLSVAPVFLVAGVSAIINVLAGRLARIIDRARTIEAQLPDAGLRTGVIRTELDLLSRRARWVNVAMTLAVISALAVSLLIALAFVDAFLPLNLAVIVAVLFVTAMFAFSGALLAFLREIHMASVAMRFGIRTSEDSTRAAE